MPNGKPNSWDRVEKLVMSKLDASEKRLGRIEEKVNKIYVDLGILKFKASTYGLIAGAIPSAIAIIYFIVTKK